MDGWMDEWMDGWIDDGWFKIARIKFVLMQAFTNQFRYFIKDAGFFYV